MMYAKYEIKIPKYKTYTPQIPNASPKYQTNALKYEVHIHQRERHCQRKVETLPIAQGPGWSEMILVMIMRLLITSC